MPLSTTQIGQLLKEFFLSPVQEQLNRETIALDLFEKARVNWAGRIAVIPIHTGSTVALGGPSVQFSDAGAVPNATTQDFATMQVEARRLLARFQVDGMVMSAARKGNTDQVINWMEGSMDLLTEDVRDTMNQTVFSGGQVWGYATFAAAAGTGAPGAFVGAYFGDIVKLAAEIGAGVTTCNLVDVNTGAIIDTAAITLHAGAVAAREATFTLVGGITVPQADMILAVEITSTNVTTYADEPLGIYGNLGSSTMFSIVRAGTPILASNGFKPTTAVARAPLSLDVIQTAIDSVLEASGEDIDTLFMNPLQRQTYTALLTANLQTVTDRAGRGDGGFTGLSYGGVEIRSSRACGRGGMVLMSIKHWKLLQLDTGGFADFDGSALSRVANTDAAEGYYRHYYNTACTRPNAQAVIAGLDIS